MKNFYSLVAIFISLLAFSQGTESIKGSVIEEATGIYIAGANVVIKNPKKSSITDASGNFVVNKLSAGKYEIQVSAIGFDTKIVSEIDVIAGEVAVLTISLAEKKNTLDEIVITKTRAKAESVKSLLTLQKNSSRVSDGISAETIKRTPDKTTSDVLKRISGASIQDNKFVIIRGLNDRYNTSFLNGAPLPSSEPDRKAFSFDIFPANMIDNLVIYKTATPDLPGEFAGGVIEINTKSVPDKSFQTLSVGSGYNTITTNKEQLTSKGGKTDWIGVDDGSREFAAGFPTSAEMIKYQNANNSDNLKTVNNITKNNIFDWSIDKKNFAPNFNLQYSFGKHIKSNNTSDFGYIFSLTSSTTQNFNETNRKSYEDVIVLTADFNDKAYVTQTLFGAIGNFSLKLNPNNTFSFKNLYSINSDKRINERLGINDVRDIESRFTNTTSRLFTSNSIYTGQLSGDHYLSKSKIKINWTSGFSLVERDTPNDRRNTYTFVKSADGTTIEERNAPFSLSASVTNETPAVFFSANNKEDINSLKVDLSKKITFENKVNLDFKVGFFSQNRNRIFKTRLLGYVPLTGNIDGVNYNANAFQSSINLLPIDQIYTANNFGIISTAPPKSGLKLFEATKQRDSYTASSKLNAIYAMFDDSYAKFRLIWGLRIENYNQFLESKTDADEPLFVNNSQTDYLPSANLIFGVTKKQNLRLSFSKTLNRPEFRELAPFLFFDVTTGLSTEGDPKLKIATINNYDFRYEFFPGKAQLFSVSLFYKQFKDPIELQALANNSNKYANAISGEAKGIELEYRTLLSTIFGAQENKLLDDITLFSNLAIIRSKVDISNLFESDKVQDIPLQGQSPYVFNAGIQYINNDAGWSTSINANRIGDRIAIQANQTANNFVPAMWEKSRTFLDMQIAKSFMKNKFEIKFNMQNVLAQNQLFYFNNDKPAEEVTGFDALVNDIFNGSKQNTNGYNEAVDDARWLTKFGKTFSLTATYNF